MPWHGSYGKSPSVSKIWCAPGNGGIANDAECVTLNLNDVVAAGELADDLDADLTIVGPELPLVAGIADEFIRRRRLLLGPSRAAAQLEGSKIFAKQFMERHQIPTASVCGIYDSHIVAKNALNSSRRLLVIKADGLCAGKGVLVTASREEAAEFVDRLMNKQEFGEAGSRLLFEEGLLGEELSYIVLTDGEHFASLAPTRDHKRAFDNDEGPNTGGMGAYSTDDLLSRRLERRIIETIVRPTLVGLRADGLEYRGFLYFGLMLTPEGPKVLEYNCRLGDPETEALLIRGDFDLAQACKLASEGNLGNFCAQWLPGASISVVLASEGYPYHPQIGREIYGLGEVAAIENSFIFHAGTRLRQPYLLHQWRKGPGG